MLYLFDVPTFLSSLTNFIQTYASLFLKQVSGHAEDDSHETGSTGRLETGPPDGGYNAARVADMLGEAAAVLGRILAIVANDSDVEDKNGKD